MEKERGEGHGFHLLTLSLMEKNITLSERQYIRLSHVRRPKKRSATPCLSEERSEGGGVSPWLTE